MNKMYEWFVKFFMCIGALSVLFLCLLAFLFVVTVMLLLVPIVTFFTKRDGKELILGSHTFVWFPNRHDLFDLM